MGIFNKWNNNEPPISNTTATIISEGSLIFGELNFSGSVHIDGQVEGSIMCQQVVTVGKKGKVKGIINSYVEGNAESNIIEILSGKKFNDEITYNEIMIELKGIFEGTVKLRTGKVKSINEVKNEISG